MSGECTSDPLPSKPAQNNPAVHHSMCWALHAHIKCMNADVHRGQNMIGTWQRRGAQACLS